VIRQERDDHPGDDCRVEAVLWRDADGDGKRHREREGDDAHHQARERIAA